MLIRYSDLIQLTCYSTGEIRDEAAVGRGSTTKAGLSGFFVSDLRIPGHEQPWEADIGKPFQVIFSLHPVAFNSKQTLTWNSEFLSELKARSDNYGEKY